MKLIVMTPERTVFETDAAEIGLPGSEGRLGIRDGHQPLITLLKPGLVTAGTETVAIAGGFAEIRDGEVAVLADAAERAEELDLAAVEEAVQRARNFKAEAVGAVQEQYAGALLAASLAQLAALRIRRK